MRKYFVAVELPDEYNDESTTKEMDLIALRSGNLNILDLISLAEFDDKIIIEYGVTGK